MTTTERGHILTVRRSEYFDPEYPDFDHEIECLNVDACGGWTECPQDHEVDGQSAECGPYECDCSEDGPRCLGDEPDEGARPRPPWYEQDEFAFHGVVHTWRNGHGWTVPFDGCVVAANDGLCDEALDIALAHGCGRHRVDDEWDDTDLTLTHLRNLDDETSKHHPGVRISATKRQRQ